MRVSGDAFVPALCPHHEYLCWCLEITRQDSNAHCKADAQSKSIARQLAKSNDINRLGYGLFDQVRPLREGILEAAFNKSVIIWPCTRSSS